MNLIRTIFIAVRTLTYMTGFVLFWGWVALRVRIYDRSFGVTLPAWTATLGILFILAGGIVALLCAGTFLVRGKGTPAPFDAPREFVAVGPYKYVRNPMYVGALTVLVGFGLYERSVSILLFPFGVFLLVHLFVVGFEEPDLKRKFGATYQAYCKAVPRWIPRR